MKRIIIINVDLAETEFLLQGVTADGYVALSRQVLQN